MPIPDGVFPIGGPLLSTTRRALVAPTAELREAGVVLIDDGALWRVNDDATGWQNIVTGEGAAVVEVTVRLGWVPPDRPNAPVEADVYGPAHTVEAPAGDNTAVVSASWPDPPAGANDDHHALLWVSAGYVFVAGSFGGPQGYRAPVPLQVGGDDGTAWVSNQQLTNGITALTNNIGVRVQ